MTRKEIRRKFDEIVAFAEVENQGALMCGYHAGNAIRKEIEGKDGFKDYVDWWLKSFEFLNSGYFP